VDGKSEPIDKIFMRIERYMKIIAGADFIKFEKLTQRTFKTCTTRFRSCAHRLRSHSTSWCLRDRTQLHSLSRMYSAFAGRTHRTTMLYQSTKRTLCSTKSQMRTITSPKYLPKLCRSIPLVISQSRSLSRTWSNKLNKPASIRFSSQSSRSSTPLRLTSNWPMSSHPSMQLRMLAQSLVSKLTTPDSEW